MIPYILTCFVMYSGIFTWNVATDPILSTGPTENLIRVALVLLVIPVTAMTGAAAIIHRARPRRLFDTARPRLIASATCGLLTCLLSMIITAILVVFLDKSRAPNDLFDAAATGGSALISTTLVLLLLCRRRQVGCCQSCSYDIRGSLNVGRCPECGMAF